MAYVYRHIRLDKNIPFYVGIGFNDSHKRAYNSIKRSDFWKNIYFKTEILVEILLDEVTYDFAKQKEKEFISLYGRLDKNSGTLVNLTDGGDGCLGRIETDYKRRRISETHKGVPKSIEVRLKMSKSKIGTTITEETRAKLINSHLGKKMTYEQKQKISNKLKGRIFDENYRDKLSKSSCSLEYHILNKDGIIDYVTNLRKYCIEKNISPCNLNKNLKTKGYVLIYKNKVR